MPNTSSNRGLLVVRIAAGYKKICGVMGVISALTIAVMMLSTTTDTFSRYFFNYPLSGVFELNEVILVICVYLALAWTQFSRGHIRVNIFLQRLSSRNLAVMDMVAWSACLAFISLVAWQSTIGAWHSILLREFRWGSVQMPIWWVKSMVPLGCYLLGIQLLIDIWMEIERLRRRLDSEAAEQEQDLVV